MIAKKEMVAMLLAGGAGNRLYVLTKERAKPAVPFGGKYKGNVFCDRSCGYKNGGKDF